MYCQQQQDVAAANSFLANTNAKALKTRPNPEKIPVLIIDCANGVGGNIMKKLANMMLEFFRFRLENIDDHDKLNENCGSEYCQKKSVFPVQNISSNTQNRLISLDGDADRVIYVYQGPQKPPKILDGDRILALFALFLVTIVRKIISQLEKVEELKHLYSFYRCLEIGASTTFVCNEGCIQYLRNGLGLKLTLE